MTERQKTVSLQVPEHASSRLLDAVREVVRCASRGFTGKLQIDFKQGEPLSASRTEHWRLAVQDKTLTDTDPPR